MPHILVLFSFVICLLVSCSSVNAEGKTESVQLYDVKTLSLDDGLVQSSVQGLIQDRQGLIWLGTQAGVQTFDGLHLKRLDQLIDGEVNSSIIKFRVNQILEGHNGDILIATNRNGLYAYNQQQRKIHQFTANGFNPQSDDKTPFYEICQDQSQQIWAATGNGLYQIDPIKGSWQIMMPSPPNGRFLDVICDENEIITRRQSELIKYNKTTKQSQLLPIQANIVKYDSLIIKKVNQRYTLVGKQDGLFRLAADFSRLDKIWPISDDALNQMTGQPIDKSLSAVNDILLADSNSVWVGTKHLGLVLIELSSGKELKRIANIPGDEHGLSGNSVLRLMSDQSRLLWVSVEGVGVDRLSVNQMTMRTFYNHGEAALVNNDITAITKGPDNTQWFVTNRSGIKRYSSKTSTDESFTEQATRAYQQHVPNKVPYISDLIFDKQNRLWFTTNEGIVRLNITNQQSQFYPQSSNNQQGPRTRGRDMLIDQDDNLYISDLGGILRYNPVTDIFIRHDLEDNSLPDAKQRLSTMRQHHDGSLYVLGDQNIYWLNNNLQLEPVFDASQLSEAFGGGLSSFAITDKGDFYISAYGALIEVNMSQPDNPMIINHSGKALPDNFFYAIELDNKGNPWLSTNKGLVHFNTSSQKYYHFSLSDGVLVREFNGQSSFKQDNGHILFGGIDGWTQVSPEKLRLKNNPPSLILSSFQIGSRDPQLNIPEKGIHMAFSEHWLQFSFSALDYHSVNENQYTYFLQGFDPNWRSFGNKSTISFTGLPSGSYTLRAKAATKRSSWHPEELIIPITIQPPFYRSTLAYSSYVALFALLVWLILWRRYILNTERAHNLELIESSQERMKLALWGSDNSLWDWDINDNEIFRTSIHFLGYGEEKVATSIESFKALIHPEDLPMFEHELGEVLNDHTAEYSAQYRLKAKNGTWHWIADQGKVVNRAPNHTPIRLSGTLRDISLLKQHEKDLEKLNQELETKIKIRTQEFADQNTQLSNTLGTLKNAQKQLVESEKMASLGNLVAGISHEINTPVGIALTAATHSSETIRQLQALFYDRNLTVSSMKKGLQQLLESNELVESSIHRTAHLIQTFKQVAVDHNHHEWRIIELPIYLIEIIPTFNSLLGGTNHKLTVIDNDFFDVECAPGDLYQIVSQLVNNTLAHGFCQTIHGKIIIETLQKDDHWVLRYSDNGIGLDHDALPHIFDPFYTTKRCDGFAGLGLHLVYNIVSQSLGGTIECISEIGQGLTFILKLPLHKPPKDHW
ncbi:MAG: signal transduction histidine kinase/ligand-binding sensor domain-containing protein [Alteromonadaceae bacterium]|jgi:signal transduction histidine kinase/ligand-binding sensor domain-containing protein